MVVVGGYTNTAGTSPTVFSVMEKPVSDAKKMGSASEKSVLVPQTVVSMRKTIALIVETKVSIAGTRVSTLEKMASRLENIFSTTKTMVKIDRCCKFICSNCLAIGFDHGPCVGVLGMGNKDHGREA